MDFSELVLLFVLLLLLLFSYFLSFSFSSFFFFSHSFLIISRVAGLRVCPGRDGLPFSWGFPLRCSFCFSCFCCFKYYVKLSSVCVVLLSVSVDLLQVPGFTALACPSLIELFVLFTSFRK